MKCEYIDVPPAKRLIGKFVGLWRKTGRTAARIDGVQDEGDHERLVYTILSGIDTGKKCSARYFPTTAAVFDDVNDLLASVGG
jgi:hypothetical protein